MRVEVQVYWVAREETLRASVMVRVNTTGCVERWTAVRCFHPSKTVGTLVVGYESSTSRVRECLNPLEV